MNRENPVLRPYDHLEEFEKMVEDVQLDVFTYTTPVKCGPGETVIVDSVELRQLGLKITPMWQDNRVASALQEIQLSEGDVEVVVVVDAGFLRQRSVVSRCSLTELESGLTVVELGKGRPRAMQDKRQGYVLSLHLVLARELGRAPLRPWRKGTVLAETSFRIKPSFDFAGLDPEPLTEDVIREHQLPRQTHTFVLNESDSLLDLESLHGNLRVFVNEDIYAVCSSQRDAATVQHMMAAAISALGQIVYMVSEELAQRTDIERLEDDRPPIVRVIEAALDSVPGKSVDLTESLVKTIRSNPQKVAAALTGAHSFSKRSLTILSTTSDDVEDD